MVNKVVSANEESQEINIIKEKIREHSNILAQH